LFFLQFLLLQSLSNAYAGGITVHKKKKGLRYTMLRWSIVTHAYARQIADIRIERRLRAAYVASKTSWSWM